MLLRKGSIYKQHKDDTGILMQHQSMCWKKKSIFLRGKEKDGGVFIHKASRKVLSMSQPQNLEIKMPYEG